MENKNRMHFTITSENLKYLSEFKTQKGETSMSSAIDQLIKEHRENIFVNRDELLTNLSKQISVDTQKNINNELKKIRINLNKLTTDSEIIFEIINGFLILNDIDRELPSSDQFLSKSVSDASERVKKRIVARKKIKDGDLD
jgi:hypothetical protein